MRHQKIIFLVAALFFVLSASAEYVDGTVNLQNTVNGTTKNVKAEAKIDQTNHIIIIGNGQNACIPQYTEGQISVPGKIKISDVDYTVQSVNQLAFRLCSSLKEVVVEQGVTRIGDFAFVGCSSLQKITLPESLTSIGSGAFVNLPALTTVVCNRSYPPTWENTDLFEYEGTAEATSRRMNQRTLIVPHNCVENYKYCNKTQDSAGTNVTNDEEKPNDVSWTDAFMIITSENSATQLLEVGSFAEIDTIRYNVNNGINNYGDYIIHLTADLHQIGDPYTWTPIGTEEHPFKGVFYGDGYLIKNVTFANNQDYVGLFGYVDGAIIGNMVLQDVRMKGLDHVGVVAGKAVNSAIEDILIFDAISSENDYTVQAMDGCAGGLVGSAEVTTIDNCYFRGKVKGKTNVGGIAGSGKTLWVTDCASGYSVENDYVDGTIGGIIGSACDNTYVYRSYSRNKLTGQVVKERKGGIVGLYTSKGTHNCIMDCGYIGEGNNDTYLETANPTKANENASFIDHGWSYYSVDRMYGRGMEGVLGRAQWYYFHEDLKDFPVPATLAEYYLTWFNFKDRDGFIYAPIGDPVESYSIIGYEGNALEITLPQTFNGKPVTTVADHTFQGIAFNKLVIPDNITTIEEKAFADTELTTIEIGAGVTGPYNGWLDGSAYLSSITVAEGNTAYTYEDGVLYDKAKTTLIRCSSDYRRPGVLTVPGTVTSMAPAAFANCIVWVDLRQTSTPWHVDRESPSSPFYDAVNFSLFVVNKNCTVSVGEPNVVVFYDSPTFENRSYCNELIVSDELGYRSPVAFKAGSVKYDRVFTAKIALNDQNNYELQPTAYTVCLPFFSYVPKNKGIKAYEYNGITTTIDEETGKTITSVNFVEETEADPSGDNYRLFFNYPYYIVVDDMGNFTIGSEVETAANVVTDESGLGTLPKDGYRFFGTLFGKSNEELYGDGTKPAYILQSDGNWHKVPANQPKAYVGPFRCYFQAEGSADSNTLFTAFDNDVTGITIVRTTDLDGTQHYYDLNGRRLNGKPESGIYIFNGKKYISK